MSRVLYVCMPFASAAWASLGLSTLKAIGQQAGIESDILYLNIPFAQTIGELRYNKLREVIISEICFTCSLFPDISPDTLWQQYMTLSRAASQNEATALAELERDFIEIITSHAPALLDTAMVEIYWDQYDIIGFTTGYHQTVASLAFARRIRERFADKIILFGGPACDGEMGPTLLKHFEMIDVVVSGEGDLVIVPLIHALRQHTAVDQWPEVYARVSERVVVGSPRQALWFDGESRPTAKIAMDTLPIPDYDDYFAQIAPMALEEKIRIPFESSRGCWWGQKHLCTFCGLNSDTIAYRAKSPEKVIAEIRAQYARYGQTNFLAADNIFAMLYFKTLLPALKELHERDGITLFYETKSNLREEQIRLFAEAGVMEVQPGIESFSDHILKLMNKGTTGLNQIRFLRDCASYGVETHYGILWGNPGETAEDYLMMTSLIPFIRHLPPPNYVVPVSLERFSRYFADPDAFGIRNIRPAPIYHIMFGGRALDYERLAYVFYYEHESDRDPLLSGARNTFYDTVAEWKSHYRPSTLLSYDSEGVLYIVDQRSSSPQILRLSGNEREMCVFCTEPRTMQEIGAAFADISPDHCQNMLNYFVERQLMLRWNGERQAKHLFLPLRVTPHELYTALQQVMRRTSENSVCAASV